MVLHRQAAGVWPDSAGNNLATSHSGTLKFDNGLSLLVATDNPPDYLEVLPDRKIYARTRTRTRR
jgi:hypothetical protein